MKEQRATERQLAETIKEGIYISFVALAVLLAEGSHSPEPLPLIRTLVISTIGMAAAIMVADLVSHVSVHDKLMSKTELVHAFRASTIGLAVIAPSVILLACAVAGILDPILAIQLSIATLVLCFVAIGAIAIRGTQLTFGSRVLVLFIGAALGIGVIALEYLAHG